MKSHANPSNTVNSLAEVMTKAPLLTVGDEL